MQGDPLSNYTNTNNNYKIFIDSSALLSDNADKFWIKAMPVLAKDKAKVIIASKVYDDIAKISKSSSESKATRKKASKILSDIISYKDADFVDVRGEPNDLSLSSNIFVEVFPKLINKYNLLLITQDGSVSNEVMALNKSNTSSNNIKVLSINDVGLLSPVAAGASSQTKVVISHHNTAGKQVVSSNRKPVPANEKFQICNVITEVSNKITINKPPKAGDTLTAKDGSNTSQVKLTEEIARGGEGVVFHTNLEDKVAKIYFANKVSGATYEKLKLICSKPIMHEGICFPSSLLYNEDDEFVGFLMPKAEGEVLATSIFAPSMIQKKFPKWKKADLAQLCLTILDKINYLHDRNILLGDINPNNILVKSPTCVYFVDTDSYQVEGYPCPVCNMEFTSPELQNKTLSEFLRTLGNERFAIATLMFKIMMLGKHPYSIQDGDTVVNNIRNGAFAYIPNVHEQGKIPEGPWLFLWSHLSFDLKQAFYDTFNKKGAHYAEHLRMSSYEWQDTFENYLTLLTNGKMKAQDSMSLKMLPTRCKKFNKS